MERTQNGPPRICVPLLGRPIKLLGRIDFEGPGVQLEIEALACVHTISSGLLKSISCGALWIVVRKLSSDAVVLVARTAPLLRSPAPLALLRSWDTSLLLQNADLSQLENLYCSGFPIENARPEQKGAFLSRVRQPRQKTLFCPGW